MVQMNITYILVITAIVVLLDASASACPLFLNAAFPAVLLACQAAAIPSTETPTRLSSAEIAQFQVKAEAGDPVAQLKLGMAYEDGNGVAQKDSEAVKWYRKAAEQGNATAQNDLGLMYWSGRGVEKNQAGGRELVPEISASEKFHSDV